MLFLYSLKTNLCVKTMRRKCRPRLGNCLGNAIQSLFIFPRHYNYKVPPRNMGTIMLSALNCCPHMLVWTKCTQDIRLKMYIPMDPSGPCLQALIH